MAPVARGDIWLAGLDPTRGREQAGVRPVLVISHDSFNNGPAGLVVTLPLTTKDRGIASHIAVMPREGGLKKRSLVICEQVRCISRGRLHKKLGRLEPDTMREVERLLRLILDL